MMRQPMQFRFYQRDQLRESARISAAPIGEQLSYLLRRQWSRHRGFSTLPILNSRGIFYQPDRIGSENLAGFDRLSALADRNRFVRLPITSTAQMEEPNNQDTFMKHTRILLLIVLLAAAAVGSSRLDPATITVTNRNDNGTGSLRQALADAVDGDTINFNSSLNGQTITLTSGELLVDKGVTINGPGANMLAVDANHTSRVFYIA